MLEHLVGSCAPSRFGFQAPEFETKKRLIESSGINPVQHSFHVRGLASGKVTGDIFGLTPAAIACLTRSFASGSWIPT